MEWLGAIPGEALVEIRRAGALQEIRQVIGAGIEDIARAKPEGFHRSADQVVENLQQAFEEHRSRVRELSQKKWRFALRDVGTWLVVGSLEVAAAATGTPMYGLLGVLANQVVDSAKLKDLPPKVKALVDETRAARRSPVGLLFALQQDGRRRK